MWGRGRGWRNWYYATGMPGWMRASYGLPAFGGRDNPYPFCRFFPWLPRWWWSGMYGPVQWTAQGPVLTSQAPVTPQPTTQTMPYRYPQTITSPTMPTMQPQTVSEIDALKQQKEMLMQELKMIEQRIKELKG